MLAAVSIKNISPNWHKRICVMRRPQRRKSAVDRRVDFSRCQGKMMSQNDGDATKRAANGGNFLNNARGKRASLYTEVSLSKR